MGIKGGVGGQSGNPDDKEDEGIFISWVSRKYSYTLKNICILLFFLNNFFWYW